MPFKLRRRPPLAARPSKQTSAASRSLGPTVAHLLISTFFLQPKGITLRRAKPRTVKRTGASGGSGETRAPSIAARPPSVSFPTVRAAGRRRRRLSRARQVKRCFAWSVKEWSHYCRTSPRSLSRMMPVPPLPAIDGMASRDDELSEEDEDSFYDESQPASAPGGGRRRPAGPRGGKSALAGLLRRPAVSPNSLVVVLAPGKAYKLTRPAASHVLAHQMALAAVEGGGGGAHRGGLDFYTLARGLEKSYSCSFLVNLDPDLLSLCSREDATTLDLARDALVSHARRIFRFVALKSGREVEQFCFGSTYVHLNPNYRKFDRMDPLTWKKEGVASRWAGQRGYRKSCCKVCCTDKHCSGCHSCRRCQNGPVRGNYDGLVVLTAVTRDTLPNQPIIVSKRTSISRKVDDRKADHELFAHSLENVLSTHFMYGDLEYSVRDYPP